MKKLDLDTVPIKFRYFMMLYFGIEQIIGNSIKTINVMVTRLLSKLLFSCKNSNSLTGAASLGCFLDRTRGVPRFVHLFILPPLIRSALHSCECDYIWSDGPRGGGPVGRDRRSEEGKRQHTCPLHTARCACKYTRNFHCVL